MNLVFDSSPLIYFARSGTLQIVAQVEGAKYLPPVVYTEVVTIGQAQGYPDAEITDHLIRQGLFTVLAPKEKFTEVFQGLHRDLHSGEMEVLALAEDLQGIAILDDRIGREIGEIFQIEVRGSVFILFTLVRKGIISTDNAKQTLRVMIREGFRIGTEQYGAFLDLLDQIT
ncbi:MAG TPA: DUF3368 domain-containing protein [Methanospirillum sp.]|nr:DUF3368 domain-containing protein [Methanospirillum sp.]